MIRSLVRDTAIGRPLAGCFAAILLCVPTELQSQWSLTYRGTVEGRFTATCPTFARGTVPKAGRVVFKFLNSGNDAKPRLVSEWRADRESARISEIEEKVAADGTATGTRINFIGGGRISWYGRFRLGSDGSVQASGAISPEPGDEYGCTGTWSAGATAAPGVESAVCADYRARLESVGAEHRKVFWNDPENPASMRNVLSDLEGARNRLQEAGRQITEIKTGGGDAVPGPLAYYENTRGIAYRDIKDLLPRERRHKELLRELGRLNSAASAAGCTGLQTVPKLPNAADETVNALLSLDSQGDERIDSKTIAVGLVTGSVEVESQGSKGPLRNGTRIPLDASVIIRTGPGSTVIIKVGGIQKTVQPGTTIRIVPLSDGQTGFVEQGGTTADVETAAPYRMQTPTATVDVDGTIFTVSYDPSRGVTAVMVEEGRVTVRPTNSAVRPVTLGPGEYVEVGRTWMTAVLPAPGAPGNLADNPPIYPPVMAENIDLTGLWRDDTGGGAIYRLRQVGNWVYWIVDGTPKGSYVNLSYGQISGNTITGIWVDMPGSPTLSGGNLTLRIESNDRLVKVGSTGYGAQAWIRVSNPGGNRQ